MLSLKTLNTEQRKSVEFIDGPTLIVAGAGSGKTRVLTYKVAHLIEMGFEPDSILALTFTNKAANEMKDRIKRLVGVKANTIWMGTFHSIFSRILRKEAKCIGHESNFTIYDSEDSLSLVSNTMESLNLSLEQYNANSIRHRISYLKNHMIDPKTFKSEYSKTFPEQKVYEVYLEYQKRLLENNSMDFDDLLLKPIEMFNKNPRLLQKYRKKFKYILVDEFQDTNLAQYELIKLLSPKNNLITVVGDDAQSIYSWRGATISNILNFEKDFPKCQVFKLEQNYRSTKNILAVADSVIKKNSAQIEKKLWTNNAEGEQVVVIKCTDEKDEAYQIAEEIKDEIKQNKKQLKDFAILYRTNAQSRSFEDVFRRERIPYRIIGGVEFFKRKEIKDIIAYLKVLNNPVDEESLLRILNFPQRGIGVTTIQRMIHFSRKQEISLFDTLGRIFEVIDIKERIQKNVKNFKVLLDKYLPLAKTLSIEELTRSLIDELGLISEFSKENTQDSHQRIENIGELLNSIKDFTKTKPDAKLSDYLQDISLIIDLDKYDDSANAVTLQTVHSVKGLEYPIVFVSGCEEDIFPLAKKFSYDVDLEEERRLFYVALTRAREKLFISYSRSRYRFGEVAYQNRSRFIDEIDPCLISECNAGSSRRTNRKSKKELFYEQFKEIEYTSFADGNQSLRSGVRVMHEKFGIGKVLSIVGAGDNQRITIHFEGNNTKQLMLKFAKLKILNYHE